MYKSFLDLNVLATLNNYAITLWDDVCICKLKKSCLCLWHRLASLYIIGEIVQRG